MVIQHSLYTNVVKIASDYLGPAGSRFIDRQIRNHLHKRPENITQADLEALCDWTKLAMGLLTEDKQLTNEFTRRLKRLARGSD